MKKNYPYIFGDDNSDYELPDSEDYSDYPENELMEEIEKVANEDNSIIGYSIQLAFKNKVDPAQIISTIKSQAADNYGAIVSIFGRKLTKKICG